MSDLIRIEGIHAFGYHGVFDFEREKGQDFFVDLSLRLDLTRASQGDQLVDSVDYASACDLVVAAITGPPMSLLERLAGEIADALLSKYPLLESVLVTVHKPDAPLKARVRDIAVSIERAR